MTRDNLGRGVRGTDLSLSDIKQKFARGSTTSRCSPGGSTRATAGKEDNGRFDQRMTIKRMYRSRNRNKRGQLTADPLMQRSYPQTGGPRPPKEELRRLPSGIRSFRNSDYVAPSKSPSGRFALDPQLGMAREDYPRRRWRAPCMFPRGWGTGVGAPTSQWRNLCGRHEIDSVITYRGSDRFGSTIQSREKLLISRATDLNGRYGRLIYPRNDVLWDPNEIALARRTDKTVKRWPGNRWISLRAACEETNIAFYTFPTPRACSITIMIVAARVDGRITDA